MYIPVFLMLWAQTREIWRKSKREITGFMGMFGVGGYIPSSEKLIDEVK